MLFSKKFGNYHNTICLISVTLYFPIHDFRSNPINENPQHPHLKNNESHI